MRISIFAALFLLASTAWAQQTTIKEMPVDDLCRQPNVVCVNKVQAVREGPRVLVGIQGGQTYGNTNLGVEAGVEVPFAKRFELDVKDLFSPYEGHKPYGFGVANVIRAGGIVWLSRTVGITGSAEYSNYAVRYLSKGNYYAWVGPIFRFSLLGSPNRVEVDYSRQFRNGISSGLETQHLQGARVEWTTRMGCSGPACFRLGWNFSGGTGLEQGPPQCDGAYGGPITCPRKRYASGGFNVFFDLEFPRHKSTELEVF